MQSFTLSRPGSVDAACAAAAGPGAAFIAGGTDLMQLMKQEVERPSHLVDLDGVLSDTVEVRQDGLRIGALARMSDVAAHPEVRRSYRAISEALLSAASPQIRNMGTIGGNLLQRTRCNYFRDPGFAACNKRSPGSGCAAIHGENRLLGVFGNSANCIATHPSDLPVVLAALNATVALQGPGGARRSVEIGDFYRLPGDTPQSETGPAARRADRRHRGAGQRRGTQFALSQAARPRELRVRAGFLRRRAGGARRRDPRHPAGARRRRAKAVAAAARRGVAARRTGKQRCLRRGGGARRRRRAACQPECVQGEAGAARRAARATDRDGVRRSS